MTDRARRAWDILSLLLHIVAFFFLTWLLVAAVVWFYSHPTTPFWEHLGAAMWFEDAL